jgi:hypothetical protein
MTIFLCNCNSHKQCILSIFLEQPLKPFTLAGFEPGSRAPQADAMTTASRRHGII